jgi:c-di-GMP-binding flagellar brake protein YcgR
MDSIPIRPGMRVTLEVIAEHDSEQIQPLDVVVKEVVGDYHILIYEPGQGRRLSNLPQEMPMLMCFVKNSKRYVLPVYILERFVRDHLVFAKMERLGNVENHQRRESYRIPVFLPIKVEFPTAPFIQNIPVQMDTSDGYTIDLSETGLRFLADKQLKKDQNIRIKLYIDNMETLGGLVVRVNKLDHRKCLYDTAIKLIYTDQRQRARFYKYILTTQFEVIKIKN